MRKLAPLVVLLSACPEPAKVAPPPTPPAQTPVKTATVAKAAVVPEYVLTGDLPEIEKKGVIRFLVPATPDTLPRAVDPRTAEQRLAEEIAGRLKLKAVFIPVEERDRLIDELDAGRGDAIVASMTITDERQKRVAFTRPIRFVKQLLVTKKGNTKVKAVADLAGQTVVVRPSSAYAQTLAALQPKTPGLEIAAAGETEDTFDLIQKVARGEAQYTVADSDIFQAATTFETEIEAPLELTDKDPIAWGLRKSAAGLKTALDAAIVESALTSHQAETYKADLDEIKKRKVIRVLTRNASNCFFIYRGEQLGFEYELAADFAKSLGVRLEPIVAPSREALFDWLAEGKGDLIAAGLTVTPERSEVVDFTAPYLNVSELVIVGANAPAKELTDLKGKKISVRKSSSYYGSLEKRRAELGFEIDVLPETMETEEILRSVGEGKLFATVADSNIVEIELTYSDKIRSLGPLGEPRELAWAVRKDQPALKAEADAFVKRIWKGTFYNLTVAKYFKNQQTMRRAAGDERSDKEGELSPYDAIVKKHAKSFELDWRLVTSQMYQESHFDPHVKSWVGALGLMQVMPQTAKELKVDDVVDPDKGVFAGVKLLARYAKMFEGPTVKEKDRIRFALAAYNCGPGHIFDARRLAKDQGLNPDRWFQNVEKAMLLLSDPNYAKRARYGYCRCSEPVKYVSEIQSRYDAYSKLVGLD